LSESKQKDVKDDWISVEYLHKKLVDMVFAREISSDVMQIFFRIISKWDVEKDKYLKNRKK